MPLLGFLAGGKGSNKKSYYIVTEKYHSSVTWYCTRAYGTHANTLQLIVIFLGIYVVRYINIYIARCQVVVKFYRDLYFGYSPPYRSCGD